MAARMIGTALLTISDENASVKFDVGDYISVTVEAFADQGDWSDGVLDVNRSVSGGQFFALQTPQTLSAKTASITDAIDVNFRYIQVRVSTKNSATCRAQILVWGRTN